MPVLKPSPATDYTQPLLGWRHWMPEGKDIEMRSEGWKLHVGGKPENAQTILSAVLPVLQLLEVAHKFLPNTDNFATQTGEQTGKWFTVYPNSVLHAFVCVFGIDEALTKIGIKENDVTKVPNDKSVGQKVVFTRYGGYDERKIRNGRGALVDDSVGHKPSWIVDPWGRYTNYAKKSNPGSLPHGWADQFPKYDHRGRSK